jgi:hypothetical protein
MGVGHILATGIYIFRLTVYGGKKQGGHICICKRPNLEAHQSILGEGELYLNWVKR